MIGGFGAAGQPVELIERADRHRRTATSPSSTTTPATATIGLAALIREGGSARSSARSRGRRTPGASTSTTDAGKIELELVPQGNLAERIRAAGAGIGAFFTPTGYGTPLAEGKEVRRDRRPRLRAGVPDPRRRRPGQGAHRRHGSGNLVYRKTARNFGPIMAAAATTTIAQVTSVVPVGGLDPEIVVTPGIYVDRVVQVAAAAKVRRPHGISPLTSRARPARRRTRWLAAVVARDIPPGCLRQPRHRPAHQGLQPPAGRLRGHAAHRERHARDGSGGRTATRSTRT